MQVRGVSCRGVSDETGTSKSNELRSAGIVGPHRPAEIAAGAGWQQVQVRGVSCRGVSDKICRFKESLVKESPMIQGLQSPMVKIGGYRRTT